MVKKHAARAYAAPSDAKNTQPAAIAPIPEVARSAAGTPVPPKARKSKGKPGPAQKLRRGAKAPPPASTPAKKLSALDAAAKVIAGVTKPVRAVDLIADMEKRGLWKSPNGKTPEASLYAAMIREIAAKKGEARFKKVDRGLFVAGRGV